MIYLYTKDMCGACLELKQKYKDEGIEYKERSAERLVTPVDVIDKEMFLKLAMEGGDPVRPTLPVHIEV